MTGCDILANTQPMTSEHASYHYGIYKSLHSTLFKNCAHHDMVDGLDITFINAKKSVTMIHPAISHPIKL